MCRAEYAEAREKCVSLCQRVFLRVFISDSFRYIHRRAVFIGREVNLFCPSRRKPQFDELSWSRERFARFRCPNICLESCNVFRRFPAVDSKLLDLQRLGTAFIDGDAFLLGALC